MKSKPVITRDIRVGDLVAFNGDVDPIWFEVTYRRRHLMWVKQYGVEHAMEHSSDVSLVAQHASNTDG